MLRWIIMQNDLIYRLSTFKYVDLIANQYDKQVRNYWAKIRKSKIQLKLNIDYTWLICILFLIYILN